MILNLLAFHMANFQCRVLRHCERPLAGVEISANERLPFGRDDRLKRTIGGQIERESWRLIWLEEMQGHVRSTAKTDLDTSESQKRAYIPASDANLASETPTIPAPMKSVSKKSPFFGLHRAEEVAAIYTSIDARGFIGKAIHGRGTKRSAACRCSAGRDDPMRSRAAREKHGGFRYYRHVYSCAGLLL